jgi:hypothetical protein
MVAGILIERVTGAPFAEVLSKRVFAPLGLADTDPETGLTCILLTQRMLASPEPPEVARDFWSSAYAALA